jgi:hypothetical protein
MRIEIFRVTSSPVSIEMEGNDEGVTIRDVFNEPGTGKVIGRDDETLLEAIESEYGDAGIEKLGSIRVNSISATLDTVVYGGAAIVIIPKVKAGR